MNNHNTIHETVIRDIFDVAKDFADSDEVERVTNFRNKTSIKSITSKAEALTMVFPVVCSRNMTFSTACMISKAIERKAVTMLQMLFSAANITDAEDGIDYISRFHTNLNTGSVSVDDFMHIMDTFVDENGLLQEGTSEYEDYKKIQNDMKAMNFYFECDNINDTPLDAYKIVSVGENAKILVNTMEPLNDAPDFVHRGKEKAFQDWLDDKLKDERSRAQQAGYTQGARDARDSYTASHYATADDIAQKNYDLANKKYDLDEKRFNADQAKEHNRRRENAANYYQKERELQQTIRRNDIEADKAYWANRKEAEDILKI